VSPAVPGGRRLRRTVGRWRRLGARLLEPFPVVEGGTVRSIGAHSVCFETMLAAIEFAERTVDVEMYVWEDDDTGRAFAEALGAAAGRGVAVRVLADAFGAREALAGPLRGTAACGADVRPFNPFRLPTGHRLYHRTHKKLLVVDGECGFTGGAGFSSHFSAIKRDELPWHDRMYEIRGPLVAQLVATFEADFGRWLRPRPLPPVDVPPVPPRSEGHVRGRVLRGWPDGGDFPGTFLLAVRRARRRVWIGTPYFLPPFGLRRALRHALRRSVEVRLVLPAYEGANAILWYASRRHYGGFLRRGAVIHEYGPAFYHPKLAVVDDDHAFLGSSNMDAFSWRRNAELDVVLHDAESVAMVAGQIEEDAAAARRVTLEEHRGRGLGHRLFERLTGLFDDWL
jgi:phosphatidylserine/phosphatidylglycerophosphate/cardiolipin synthase-like enzyme